MLKSSTDCPCVQEVQASQADAQAISGHAVTRRYALYATVVGAYLGWVVIASGDLVVAAVAHAAYDALALGWLIARHRPPALARSGDQ